MYGVLCVEMNGNSERRAQMTKELCRSRRYGAVWLEHSEPSYFLMIVYYFAQKRFTQLLFSIFSEMIKGSLLLWSTSSDLPMRVLLALLS